MRAPAIERGTAPTAAAVLALDGYRRLFISAAIVIFGVMGQAVARAWLARELTGSNAGLGGVMLAFGAAMLLATPAGGVAADRFSKRTVVLLAVIALSCSSAAIGVAVIADVIHYWMLLVVSVIQATAFAFYLPARIAFIAELVAVEQIGIAIVVTQTAQEAMRVIAPALAGVLIGVSWFGVGGVFLLAGATSALSAVVVTLLPPGKPRVPSTRSPIAEMVDAIGYVRARRELSLVALTTIGVVVIGFPYLIFLPALADDRYHIGAGGYGLMAGTAGLGAVIAGLLTPRVPWIVTRPWRVIGLAGGVLGISLGVLAFAAEVWHALLVLLVVGASGLVFQTSTQALMLTMSDFQYHGRMQSMVVLGFSGFGLAALPFGAFADATSLRLTLFLMGTLVFAVSAAFALTRHRHRRQLVGVEPA
jgi:MFS family permease